MRFSWWASLRDPSMRASPFSCTWPWSNSGLFRIAVELGYPFATLATAAAQGRTFALGGVLLVGHTSEGTSAVTPRALTPLSSSMTAGATLAEAVVEAGRSSNILRGSGSPPLNSFSRRWRSCPWPSGLCASRVCASGFLGYWPE